MVAHLRGNSDEPSFGTALASCLCSGAVHYWAASGVPSPRIERTWRGAAERTGGGAEKRLHREVGPMN